MGGHAAALVACLAATLFAAGISGGAQAQDASAGKRLYHDAGRLRGAETSCVDCHGALPGALHGLSRAAGNAAAIGYAINAIPQMAPLRGRLDEVDLVDLAAYIAKPDVASPELRLATSGLAHSPWSAERLEFPHPSAGLAATPSTIRLSNAGALPLQLLSAPVLGGPDAGSFAIAHSDCTAQMTLGPGQSCGVTIALHPCGTAGPRRAHVRIAHDWIRGAVHVALIGQVASTTVSCSTASPPHQLNDVSRP